MSRRRVVVYEINQETPHKLPEMDFFEQEAFDFINYEGAASPGAIIRHYNYQSQEVLNRTLASLQQKGLVTRRVVTIEHDD